MNEFLFDRKLLKAFNIRYKKGFNNYNFLYEEIANRILENLNIGNLKFESVLELNNIKSSFHGKINCKKIITSNLDIVFDDEFIPFYDNSFDLVISNLNIHFINNFESFLSQIKNILQPNGIFIASFFGETNLTELASSIYLAENKICGGVSPRMIPTIDVKTSALLLKKVGFVDSISDHEKIVINYDDPYQLLVDLKNMGQGNVLNKRTRKFFTKSLLNEIINNYKKSFKNDDGTYRATFEIITISGKKEVIPNPIFKSFKKN